MNSPLTDHLANDPTPPAPDPFSDLVSSPSDGPGRASVVPFVRAGDFIQYYHLRENPFADRVQPSSFFRTDSHAGALRDMMLAVDFKTSLGMVIGPSGTGKTLVSQMLLKHFDEQGQPVVLVLATPGLSKTGLLREILSELNIALPVGMSRIQDLLQLLHNYIIELHDEARRLVIIIDECHFLSAECLHIVRTISNLETPLCKLATCLLFGESRFAQRLQHPSYESLRTRIYLRCTLEPLTPAETDQYIKFRLMTVDRLEELFVPAAIEALHHYSGGICRSVNKLAMLSLIEGATRQQGRIDEAVVAAAARRMG